MSGWMTDDGPSGSTSTGERQRLQAPSSVTRSAASLSASISGDSGKTDRRLLSARTLLLIWSLFVLGFVLIIGAAVAYSARFAGSGTACLLCGLACLMSAFVWQCRASGASLEQVSRPVAGPYSQLGSPALNIQDDAEGPAMGFHF